MTQHFRDSQPNISSYTTIKEEMINHLMVITEHARRVTNFRAFGKVISY
jgi:hypothetical protein